MVETVLSDKGKSVSVWAPDAVGDKRLLLLMLYSKAIACMDEALVMIDAGDMIGKGEKLIRAQDIVLELTDSLDLNAGDLAGNLSSLYTYIYRRLIRGNMRLDKEAIQEARLLMEQLYQAWQQALVDVAYAA
jgi:flagellar secretion chaperone FliS